MTPTLTWEDDALILTVGPWRVWVAFVERYTEGHALAILYAWGSESSDADAIAGAPDRDPTGAALNIMCRSTTEAEAVIRALYALRGVDVPPRAS